MYSIISAEFYPGMQDLCRLAQGVEELIINGPAPRIEAYIRAAMEKVGSAVKIEAVNSEISAEEDEESAAWARQCGGRYAVRFAEMCA